jgi:hypothetical protein
MSATTTAAPPLTCQACRKPLAAAWQGRSARRWTPPWCSLKCRKALERAAPVACGAKGCDKTFLRAARGRQSYCCDGCRDAEARRRKKLGVCLH